MSQDITRIWVAKKYAKKLKKKALDEDCSVLKLTEKLGKDADDERFRLNRGRRLIDDM